MKRRMILISVLSLLMLGVAVAPVMAIGPLKALEVGNNSHLSGIPALGVVMLDGASENSIAWVSGSGLITLMSGASIGDGRMNNAIIADHDTVLAMLADETLYENKWVYLSSETTAPQWNGHGMIYWMLLPMFGPDGALAIALDHPYGMFSQRHFVGK